MFPLRVPRDLNPDKEFWRLSCYHYTKDPRRCHHAAKKVAGVPGRSQSASTFTGGGCPTVAGHRDGLCGPILYHQGGPVGIFCGPGGNRTLVLHTCSVQLAHTFSHLEVMTTFLGDSADQEPYLLNLDHSATENQNGHTFVVGTSTLLRFLGFWCRLLLLGSEGEVCVIVRN